jgi:hypothetical protein
LRDKELHPIRRETDGKVPHADQGRLGNRHWAKEATGWAEVGPGRPAQPISWPSRRPLT